MLNLQEPTEQRRKNHFYSLTSLRSVVIKSRMLMHVWGKNARCVSEHCPGVGNGPSSVHAHPKRL